MKKFKIGETFKLKGRRKVWTVINIFNYEETEYCVATSRFLNYPNLSTFGVFYISNDEIYQRS